MQTINQPRFEKPASAGFSFARLRGGARVWLARRPGAYRKKADSLQQAGNIYDKFVNHAKSIFTNEKPVVYSKCRK